MELHASFSFDIVRHMISMCRLSFKGTTSHLLHITCALTFGCPLLVWLKVKYVIHYLLKWLPNLSSLALELLPLLFKNWMGEIISLGLPQLNFGSFVEVFMMNLKEMGVMYHSIKLNSGRNLMIGFYFAVAICRTKIIGCSYIVLNVQLVLEKGRKYFCFFLMK